MPNTLKKIEQHCKEFTLNDLLEFQKSEQIQKNPTKKRFVKLLILAHGKVIHSIQNQSVLLKEMQKIFNTQYSFTYDNTELLISFLTQEHENIYEEDQNLSEEQSQPENQQPSTADHASSRFKDLGDTSQTPLQFKLPYRAMQVFQVDCSHISTLLFEPTQQERSVSNEQGQETSQQITRPPLIYKLFSFLQYHEHYLLASYFNKVMIAITKRVFSSNHKYNALFCKCVFQSIFMKPEKQQSEPTENLLSAEEKESATTNNAKQTVSHSNSALMLSINHLYSMSTCEFIKKWMSLTNKQINYEGDKQIISIQHHRKIKESFLLQLVTCVNRKSLNEETLLTICDLFSSLLQPEEASQGAIMAKQLSFPGNQNINKITSKVTPYEIATSHNILQAIIEHIDDEYLSIAKIKLLKIFIEKHKKEELKLKQLNEDKQRSDQRTQQHDMDGLKIIAQIQPQDLSNLTVWILFRISGILSEFSSNSESENSQSDNANKGGSSIVILSREKKSILLGFLELLDLIYHLDGMPELVLFQYNKMSNEIIEFILLIMRTQNNLLQLAQSKLIKHLLKWKNEEHGSESTWAVEQIEFGKKLLIQGIPKLIDIDTVRQHVISWAEIILDWDKDHIFESAAEEKQWDHVKDIVDESKEIVIGSARYCPSNLDIFYSSDKAKLVFSNFFHNFKVKVEYEEPSLRSKASNRDQSSEQKPKKKDVVISDVEQEDRGINENKKDSSENNVEGTIAATNEAESKSEIVSEFDPLSFSGSSAGYLQFDLLNLIQEL